MAIQRPIPADNPTVEERERHWERMAQEPGDFPAAPSNLPHTTDIDRSLKHAHIMMMGMLQGHIDAKRKEPESGWQGRTITCLDIATGTGLLGGAAALEGCQVLGVDKTLRMLERARGYAVYQGVEDKFHVRYGDALHLVRSRTNPSGVVDQNSFDIVILGRILIHLDWEEWHTALKQAYLALKPGGLMFIIEPMVRWNEKRYQNLPGGQKPHGRTWIRRADDYKEEFAGLYRNIWEYPCEYDIRRDDKTNTLEHAETYTFLCFDF